MDRKTGVGGVFEAPQLRSLLADRTGPDTLLAAAKIEKQQFFTIRAADSSGERRSANILIDKMYATRGYRAPALPEKETPHLITLVASDQHETIGTLTIGFDSEDGLLVDDLFSEQVDKLRASGRKVCEFTKLAMDSVVRSKRMLAALFNVAYIYAHRIKGANNLLIEVNPRHVRYYQTMLGFTVIGPKKLNRRVDAPAVLLSLDLDASRHKVELMGGHQELADGLRSLYPYFFSPREEAGITARLRRTSGEMVQVYGVEPSSSAITVADFAQSPVLASQGKGWRGSDFRRAAA